jgi:hypothetical protein
VAAACAGAGLVVAVSPASDAQDAPAALLRPNKVPCGPFRTSMRSMSLNASNEAPDRAE